MKFEVSTNPFRDILAFSWFMAVSNDQIWKCRFKSGFAVGATWKNLQRQQPTRTGSLMHFASLQQSSRVYCRIWFLFSRFLRWLRADVFVISVVHLGCWFGVNRRPTLKYGWISVFGLQGFLNYLQVLFRALFLTLIISFALSKVLSFSLQVFNAYRLWYTFRTSLLFLISVNGYIGCQFSVYTLVWDNIFHQLTSFHSGCLFLYMLHVVYFCLVEANAFLSNEMFASMLTCLFDHVLDCELWKLFNGYNTWSLVPGV